MNICVVGLWHLGSVTSACLAANKHKVVGVDDNTDTVKKLQQGEPPIYEPGLKELIQKGLQEKILSFTENTGVLKDAEVVWITYDTPVDNDDQADVQFVIQSIKDLFPDLSDGTSVLISSQIPLGTTRDLEQAYQSVFPQKKVSFSYSPENLRLGTAIDRFCHPERVVVGLRDDAARNRLAALFSTFTDHIEWMSVESAEMTKHALNGFLATSISFANEIAAVCECTGADALEVAAGLKSDKRIGPYAYLEPGAAFGGGTLARDIQFLSQKAEELSQRVPLIFSVRKSNNAHKQWVQNKLLSVCKSLRGCHVAVWGLTYKPGTDTLRRSEAIELCKWLSLQGAAVHAHDPAVKTLPEDLKSNINLYTSALDTLKDAEVVVIATSWPEYRSIDVENIVATRDQLIVIDPNRFLANTFEADDRVCYMAVGKGYEENSIRSCQGT